MIKIYNLPQNVKDVFIHYWNSLNSIKEFYTFDSYYKFVISQHDITKLKFLEKKLIKSFAKKTYNLALSNRLFVSKECANDVKMLFDNDLIYYYSEFAKNLFLVNFYDDDFYEVCP